MKRGPSKSSSVRDVKKSRRFPKDVSDLDGDSLDDGVIFKPEADDKIGLTLACPDCGVYYWKKFLNPEDSKKLFEDALSKANWKEEKAMVFGKERVVNRKMAYFGTASYRYSGSSKPGEGWPDWLLPAKLAVEKRLGVSFNYALMNHYKDGKDYIGYHSDDERDLVENGVIAALSLGANRDFFLKRKPEKSEKKTFEKPIAINLASGSLLTMEGNTQKKYKHSIPIRKKCKSPRISITFRSVKIR
jgi:alkylated DNA repair dioxygenase AlkB